MEPIEVCSKVCLRGSRGSSQKRWPLNWLEGWTGVNKEWNREKHRKQTEYYINGMEYLKSYIQFDLSLYLWWHTTLLILPYFWFPWHLVSVLFLSLTLSIPKGSVLSLLYFSLHTALAFTALYISPRSLSWAPNWQTQPYNGNIHLNVT